MAAPAKVVEKDTVPATVVQDQHVDVAAESAVPEVPQEEKLTREMSAPSATAPTDNEKLLGSAPASWEKRPFEWVGAEAPEYLPKDIVNSDQKKFLNANARENIDGAAIRPGHRFTAPGRYHDLRDIEKYYDVEAGSILPDGVYVTSERNILSEYDRKQLRGA